MSFLKKPHLFGFEAKEDLYLASDGKTIVKSGDARAAFLLARKGTIVPPKVAERIGITEDLQPDKFQAPPKVENKQKLGG